MTFPFFAKPPKRNGSAEAQRLAVELERRLEVATAERIAAIATAMHTLPANWHHLISEDTAFVFQANTIRQAMQQARQATASPAPSPNATLRFAVSSLFLRETWRYLTSDPAKREVLALVTGEITSSGERVLSRRLEVAMASQSPAYVKADIVKTNAQILQLTEGDNHPLLAMVHSHIMTGPETTRPSSTDLAHQQRMVTLGYPEMLGGIFNCSGHVRFFSTARDFQLSITGNRFRLLEDKPREKLIALEV